MALGIDAVVVTSVVAVAASGHELVRAVFGQDVAAYVPGFEAIAPALIVTWLAAIAVAGGYDRHVFGASADEFQKVARASLVCAAVIGVGCFVVRFDLSRGWFVLAFTLGIFGLLLGRLCLRSWIKRSRARGHLTRRVLVVGDRAHIDSVVRVMKREPWIGYETVGALAPASDGDATWTGVPILGDTSEVLSVAREVHADTVMLAGGAVTSPARMREIAWELEHEHTQLVVAPSMTDVARERVRVKPVGGLPLIHVEKPRSAKAARAAKRLFDTAGATTILLLLSPVFAWAALSVWLHDRGPIFFRHERIGRDGQPFGCWKFRSMATDAEARLLAVLDSQGLEHGAFAKLKADPRITKPGRWLRRYSIDELPQLFNVLSGDMSLVGPRPQTAREVESYDNAMARRLHVRPGLTGLWQVSGRSDLSVEESMRLDLYYVDNWSMLQDLAILGRTFGAVFGSRGAY